MSWEEKRNPKKMGPQLEIQNKELLRVQGELDSALNQIERNRGILNDNTVADACLRLFREKGFQIEGT